jgi:outer membrane protein assembly factor BamB
MSNYNEPVVFNCPNCGSSIAMQGDTGTCAYCGTAVERPRKTSRVPSGTTSWSVAPTAYPTGTRYDARRRGVHPILTLLLVIVAAAGGFLAGSALPNGAPSTLLAPTSPSTQLQPILKTAVAIAITGQGSVSELAAVLPRDGKGGDLLAYVYHSDSSRYTIGLIDGGSHAARWQSPLLSKEAYQGLLATSQDMLFFTDKDQLFALHLRDGAPAWQAALHVEPSPGCVECLRVLANHVAVLEKDGSLQVFDGQNGQLAWGTRLEDRPNRLLAAGDRIVTITEAADKQTRLVSFLDAGSGKPALQLAPACPSDPNISRDERPDASSPFLFSADGTTMYTMFGFFAQCAQAWDLTSGKPRWQVALDRDQMPSSWYGSPALQTDKTLYIGNDKLLWALDTANGKHRALVNEKEYQLKPLALHQNTLIVRAAPDWDSQRQELWGIDSATGERRWQIKLQAHDLREERSSGDWELHLTPKGLLVVQALRDEPQLVTELFDPATGTSLHRETTPLENIGTPSIIGSLWGDDTAWLRINGDVYAIDLATGKVDYKLQ